MGEPSVFLVRVPGRGFAELLCSYLGANGIECILSQEAAGHLYATEVGPLAEVDILVPQSKEQEARELYQSFLDGQTGEEASPPG